MAAPVSSSNPLPSAPSFQHVTSPDVEVNIATIKSFAVTTQNSASLNDRVTADFSDQSSLQVDLSLHLSTIRVAPKKSLKAPENSPDLSVNQGVPLPSIALPSPAEPQ